MIEELSKNYPVGPLCQAVQVARSGYYSWLKGQEPAREVANGQLVEQIKTIYEAKRGTYGSPRITHELRRAGQKCNHKRVERLMRQQGLKGRRGKKRKVRTTNSDHDQPVAPNLLLERAAPQKTDEVWVAVLTCPRRRAGCFWLRSWTFTADKSWAGRYGKVWKPVGQSKP